MRDALILVLFCFLCYPRLLGEPLQTPVQQVQRCLDCRNGEALASSSEADQAGEFFAAANGSDDDGEGGGCAGALARIWSEGLRGLRADCGEAVDRLRAQAGSLVMQFVAAGEDAVGSLLQAAGNR